MPTFVLVTRREIREMGKGNRFCWPTSSFYFDPPSDRHFFEGEFLRTFSFITSIRMKKSHPRNGRIYIIFKHKKQSPKSCFLYWKRFLLNSWETFKRLPITGSDFNNVSGTTLFKSLSIVATFPKILQKLRTNFPEKTFQKAASTVLMRSPFKITIFIFWGQLAERLNSFGFKSQFHILFWNFDFSSNSLNLFIQASVIK